MNKAYTCLLGDGEGSTEHPLPTELLNGTGIESLRRREEHCVNTGLSGNMTPVFRSHVSPLTSNQINLGVLFSGDLKGIYGLLFVCVGLVYHVCVFKCG